MGTSGRVVSGRLGLYRVSHPRTKDPTPPGSQASSTTPPHRPRRAGRRRAGRAAASPAAGLQEAGTSRAVLTWGRAWLAEHQQARHGAQTLTFAGAFTAGPGAWAPLVQSGSFLMRSDLMLQLVSRKGTKTVPGEASAKPSLSLASDHWEAGFRSDPVPTPMKPTQGPRSPPHPLGLPVYTRIKEPHAFQ